jgi:hypothetical protein
MTEAEWKLRKEIASLRKQIAQMLFNAADAEDKALGATYVPEVTPVSVEPQA